MLLRIEKCFERRSRRAYCTGSAGKMLRIEDDYEKTATPLKSELLRVNYSRCGWAD